MIIAFVPVRSGSKSIPLKNIKNLCDKPLVYWCLNSLNESNKIDKIFVASDSEVINNVVLNFNLNKVKIYNRLSENAQDTSSTESVMLEFINLNNFKDDDIFILTQATSPFTQSIDYNKALNLFFETKADSLLTCVRDKHFIWEETGISQNYDYKNRPRRQNFKGQLTENGAFYISTIKNIKNNKNRLSGKIVIYEMPSYTRFEIDELDDWIICESLMYKHIINKI